MKNLPVIVGFGGYNSAGRSSGHQAFLRTIIESISPEETIETVLSLALLMGQLSFNNNMYEDSSGNQFSRQQAFDKVKGFVLRNTLVREIDYSGLDFGGNESGVNVASQLPNGFEPSKYYNSKFHPRGLQLTVLGASDAIESIGFLGKR